MEKGTELVERGKLEIESATMNKIIQTGDLSGLSENEISSYYIQFCKSLNLNPVTKPFDIIAFQGKKVLYPGKNASEQLRANNKISLLDPKSRIENGLYYLTVKATTPDGREDFSTAILDITNLKGIALANAIMKTETKAKNRVTLSICGLGYFEEMDTDITGNSNKKISKFEKVENPDFESNLEMLKKVSNIIYSSKQPRKQDLETAGKSNKENFTVYIKELMIQCVLYRIEKGMYDRDVWDQILTELKVSNYYDLDFNGAFMALDSIDTEYKKTMVSKNNAEKEPELNMER